MEPLDKQRTPFGWSGINLILLDERVVSSYKRERESRFIVFLFPRAFLGYWTVDPPWKELRRPATNFCIFFFSLFFFYILKFWTFYFRREKSLNFYRLGLPWFIRAVSPSSLQPSMINEHLDRRWPGLNEWCNTFSRRQTKKYAAIGVECLAHHEPIKL